MPTGQQYGTNVSQTFLTSAIGSTTNSFTVNSSTSWPTPPFTAVFGIGTSTQEAFDVGTVSGNTWSNVTRGIDGTLAQNQPQNQTITHADIGRDFREMRSHIDASGGLDATGHNVHGISSLSQVVGTQDTQTLLGKTLNGAILNSPVIGTTTASPTGSQLGIYSNAGVMHIYDAGGADTSLQPPTDGPLLNHAIAWTMDPCQASSSNTPLSGAISINLVYVNALSTVTNFLCSVLTAGSGLTAGQNLVGIYNAAGTRVGISADQSTAWTTTGNKTAALTMTGPLEPGYYYLAFLTVGTTPPKFYGGSAVNAVQNINFASAPFRFSFLSGQTSLPTTITPSSFSAAGFIPLALIA